MFYNLRTSYNDKIYKFSPLTGFLLSKKVTQEVLFPKKFKSLHSKWKNVLEIVNNPFLLHNIKSKSSINHKRWIKNYAKMCVWFYRHCYIGLYLISRLRMDVFENSLDATEEFCAIIGDEDQRNLCLPRSIFAATTSKKFKNYGVLIIGVFFPSRQLHAWIIEDKYCGWQHDYIWTNYTPVAIMI